MSDSMTNIEQDFALNYIDFILTCGMVWKMHWTKIRQWQSVSTQCKFIVKNVIGLGDH